MDASLDTNFERVGTFTINQGELEEANGISKIFQARFLRNDADSYEARFLRQDNELKLYEKPVIGWKLSCEESTKEEDNFTRQ